MGISLPTILTTTVKKRIVSARISRFFPKFDHWMRHFYHCRENSWKPILGAETMHFNFKSVEKSRFSKTHKWNVWPKKCIECKNKVEDLGRMSFVELVWRLHRLKMELFHSKIRTEKNATMGNSGFNYSHDGGRERYRFGPNSTQIPLNSLSRMNLSTSVVRIVESVF